MNNVLAHAATGRVRQVAVGGLAVTALLAGSALAAPADAASSAAHKAPPGTEVTQFGFNGSAYGTAVAVNALPVNSSRTGLVTIACTNLAGLDRAKGVSTSNVLDAVTVDGIDTESWTAKRDDGSVNNLSRTRIAGVTIGNEVGSLTLTGITVNTRAWHDSDGYHRSNDFSIVDIDGDLGGLPIPGLPDPDDVGPNETIEVPGLVSLTLDARSGSTTATSAKAASDAVRLTLLGQQGASAIVGHAESGINRAPAGPLGGLAQGLYTDSGLLDIQNPVKKSVPCRGTNGRWLSSAAADVELPGVLSTGTVQAQAQGRQIANKQGTSRTRATVEDLSLLDGAVEVDLVKAQANVERDGSTYTRQPTGTTLGSLTVNGEEMELPDPGQSLTIPGLVTLTPQVVVRTAHGITVVGLRVELLSGEELGTTIDVAHAYARVN